MELTKRKPLNEKSLNKNNVNCFQLIFILLETDSRESLFLLSFDFFSWIMHHMMHQISQERMRFFYIF